MGMLSKQGSGYKGAELLTRRRTEMANSRDPDTLLAPKSRVSGHLNFEPRPTAQIYPTSEASVQ